MEIPNGRKSIFRQALAGHGGGSGKAAGEGVPVLEDAPPAGEAGSAR